MTYYRIFTPNNLKSFNSYGQLCVSYSTERFAEANPEMWSRGYGLFLYTKLEAAARNASDYFEIWEVEAEDIKAAPPSVLVSPPSKISTAIKVLDNSVLTDSKVNTAAAAGAKFDEIAVALRVKLIRQISEEELEALQCID